MAALAVECGNWRVFEDLQRHGASISHPSVIQACAVNCCIQRLVQCLAEEVSAPTLTEDGLRHMFDLTCEAGHVDCAQLLFEHSKLRGLYLSVQEQLLKAAAHRQHWMIDFLLSKDRTYATRGKALVICSENGDFRSLRKLLNRGADPNFCPDSEDTAAAGLTCNDSQNTQSNALRPIAIAGGFWGRSGSPDHYEVIVCLIGSSADVRHLDVQGRSILMWAVLRGHVRLAEAVLTSMRVRREGSGGSFGVCVRNSQAFSASWNNSPIPGGSGSASTGAANAADLQHYINLQDKDGVTALMHAVLSSSEDCVRLLLDWKAGVDIESKVGEDGCPAVTVLGLVTGRYREKAPSYLLDIVARSTTLSRHDENCVPFVVWAARYGHTDAVRIALERNSPAALGIHEHSEGEYSALELACMCRRRDICKLLVGTWDSSTPVPDSTRSGDFVGLGLFERFIEYEWEDVTLSLIQKISPLDVKSQIVVDALVMCVEKGWLGCVIALLDRGVSPNSISSSGRSALLLASKLNQIETLKCLLNCKATQPESAAIVALHLNHLDCFQILFGHLNHTAEFIRAAACIAALENNVKALRLILSDQSVNSVINCVGQRLGDLVAKWIPLRNLNRIEPSLYQAVVSDNFAVPLLCSVAKGSLSCTSYLLENNADPLASDEKGLTAIVWACAVGNLEIVKVLLKHGASIAIEKPIMPFYEMTLLYNLTVLEKIEGRMKKLLRRTLDPSSTNSKERSMIHVPPLLAALLKGHTDVVRLLLEAGAATAEIMQWCNETLDGEPRMEPFLRLILEKLVLYDDYKAYGPFGVAGHNINIADSGKIPDDGRLCAVVVQFSTLDWSLVAIQFVHQVGKELVECSLHNVKSPSAGNFRRLHPHAHIERLDLEEHEYIVQSEVTVTAHFVKSLRFTTNLRVTKWLGGTPSVPEDRIVTVSPVGREIVGLFSSVTDKIYQMGFLTRLRMGDFPWRMFRRKAKEISFF